MSGFELLLNVLGGVALLLWAIRMVKTGIQRAFGPNLRNTMQFASRNRLFAFVCGIGLAMVLQSATASSLLAASMLSSGVLSTLATMSAFLGAEVGSTLVVQLLSLDLRWLAPVLLLIGVSVFLSNDNQKPRQFGRVLVGLGLLLVSLNMIVGASATLRDSNVLEVVLNALNTDPMLAFFIAAILTWISHSSVAVLLLIISLTGNGVLPLSLAYVLVLGANAGAGLVVYLLCKNESMEVRTVALTNLIIRASGSLVFILFIPVIQQYFQQYGLESVQLQLASLHTLLNIVLALCALPLLSPLLSLVGGFLSNEPQKETRSEPLQTPDYFGVWINESNTNTALNNASREVLRVAERVETMLHYVPEMFGVKHKNDIKPLKALEDEVDKRSMQLKRYLTKISQRELDDEQSKRCLALLSFTIRLEQAGDLIENILHSLAYKKAKRRYRFSTKGWQDLKKMHTKLLANMQLALHVFMTDDLSGARQLIKAKERYRVADTRNLKRHLARLREGQPETLDTSAIHLDVMRTLDQINSLMASVAYPILKEEGALLKSRLVDVDTASDSVSDDGNPDSSQITAHQP